MNGNLFRKSLKEIRISWPSYMVGLLLYVYLLISIYPTVQQRSAEIQELLKSYPKGFIEIFGGGSAVSFTTVEGFLSLEFFGLMWFVIIGAFVIGYGSAALGKELESGTIEILLSQPITRTSALVTKSLNLFGSTILMVVLTVFATYIFGLMVDLKPKIDGIVALTVIGTLFFLAIGAIALFFSVLLGERGRAALATSGVLVSMYFLNVISNLANWDWMKKLDDVSLFHYYDSAKLLSTGNIPAKSLLVYSATAIVFYLGSILVFRRRDIAP
ncbi:MAG: ABC transporter permease [Candidatus Aquicultor sp.]